jgi:hypothetical protein
LPSGDHLVLHADSQDRDPFPQPVNERTHRTFPIVRSMSNARHGQATFLGLDRPFPFDHLRLMMLRLMRSADIGDEIR